MQKSYHTIGKQGQGNDHRSARLGISFLSQAPKAEFFVGLRTSYEHPRLFVPLHEKKHDFESAHVERSKLKQRFEADRRLFPLPQSGLARVLTKCLASHTI